MATMGLGEGIGCPVDVTAVTAEARLLADGPPADRPLATIRGAGIGTPLRPTAARARAMMVR